jgi:drug/metabolite transporter (DMT)-like permease
MLAAGVAWGAYSLRGRAATDALGATAGNFVRAAPVAVLALAVSWVVLGVTATPLGIVLAVLSGALASGVGYALWYAAMPALGATRASIVQLAVPVIAALAAVPLLGESPDARITIAGGLVVVGILVAITSSGGPRTARRTT